MDMVEPARGVILVVEDDRPIRNTVQELLQDEGYAVIGVASGQDTLVAIRQGLVRPDLVLLDVWLEQPDSGWRVLEALQSDQRTASIPVVVTSAHVFMMAEMQTNLAQPHYVFLKKPYDLATLLTTIEILFVARR